MNAVTKFLNRYLGGISLKYKIMGTFVITSTCVFLLSHIAQDSVKGVMMYYDSLGEYYQPASISATHLLASVNRSQFLLEMYAKATPEQKNQIQMQLIDVRNELTKLEKDLHNNVFKDASVGEGISDSKDPVEIEEASASMKKAFNAFLPTYQDWHIQHLNQLDNLKNSTPSPQELRSYEATQEAIRTFLKNQEKVNQTLMLAGVHHYNETQSFLLWSGLFNAIFPLFFGGMLVAITIPYMQQLVNFTKKVQAGDLTERLQLDVSDEVGQMGDAFNSMVDSLSMLIASIQEQSGTLLHLTQDLESSAHTMGRASEEMKQVTQSTRQRSQNVLQQIAQVSSTAKRTRTTVDILSEQSQMVAQQNRFVDVQSNEMLAQMQEMKGAAENVTSNIENFAASIEQLATSIHTISDSTNKANNVAQDASRNSEQSRYIINELSDTLIKVSRVVEMVKKIASQTNLLALNATIEAASAGEAGKGFAVVAGEVKNLSHQSGIASGDIQEHINEVQSMGQNARGAIEQVAKVINDLASVNHVIAHNADEQNSAMNSINQLVRITEKHTKEMLNVSNQSFSIGSAVSSSVRKAIEEMANIVNSLGDVRNQSQGILNSVIDAEESILTMNQSMDQVGVSVDGAINQISRVRQNIEQVDQVAEELNSLVSHFKI